MATNKIPFDLARINEEGVKVVTRDGKSVRLLCTDLKGDKKIVAAITGGTIDKKYEYLNEYYVSGCYYEDKETMVDLLLEISVKPRRMTFRELAWWLRDHPEEHREVRCGDRNNPIITGVFRYSESVDNLEVPDSIYVRSNGGEWHEPLIEE